MCFCFMDFAPSYHKCLLSGGARFASLSAFSPGAPPAPPSAGAAAVVLLRRHFPGVSRAEPGWPQLPASAPRRRSASVVPPVVWWCPRVRPRRPHPVHRAPALFHLSPLRCRGSRLPLLPVVPFLAVCVPSGPGPGPGVHHPSPHRPWSLAAHVGFRIPAIHPPRRRWPKC